MCCKLTLLVALLVPVRFQFVLRTILGTNVIYSQCCRYKRTLIYFITRKITSWWLRIGRMLFLFCQLPHNLDACLMIIHEVSSFFTQNKYQGCSNEATSWTNETVASFTSISKRWTPQWSYTTNWKCKVSPALYFSWRLPEVDLFGSSWLPDKLIFNLLSQGFDTWSIFEIRTRVFCIILELKFCIYYCNLSFRFNSLS